jgi:hypothetical protein
MSMCNDQLLSLQIESVNNFIAIVDNFGMIAYITSTLQAGKRSVKSPDVKIRRRAGLPTTCAATPI